MKEIIGYIVLMMIVMILVGINGRYEDKEKEDLINRIAKKIKD